ncbi:mitochondrial ATPase complex subunit ATP10 isoform X2 [Ananas comosus]|uniref:Mitochondrial ATPase complex subunit ATP10 isoform X2 n=1 Tax=Ananas comosus TaxID=4615 RepID=A0A6P5FPV0_ANACO|nr:mitochondrial ATPase complex subunit ATP10 isoform X2 [Ananas comosus]
MLRRLALRSSSSLADAPPFRSRERKLLDPVFSGGRALHPHPHPHALALARSFLDLHKMGSREAIEKEKTRLSDELSRGYFADISEIRQNGGKIALANKTIIPAAAAVNFPNLEVSVPDGRKLKLPASSGEKQTDTSEMPIPLASLLCLSFRASSQRMAESWSLPFVDAFSASGKIQIYEVSFIDSWLLSLGPVKHLFLKIMKKSSNPQRQIVYAFGDNYDFRKKLQILNLLTGYIFLVDRVGRIRWQGFGSATEEELSSLLSCTSLLLDDQ